MKVVILAAGKGSRLGKGQTPKPLTQLATGESILGSQLDILKRFVSLDDVIIVVGYHKEKIMDAFPQALFVYNPDYASQNTAKSLLLALNKIDEDVLWLNGDVVMHPCVIEAILQDPKTSMVVNVGQVGEEEVKYRLNEAHHIIEVSKKVQEPQGEALGINFWSGQDLGLLREQLTLCQESDYFERGIELCIQKGTLVSSVIVDSSLCTEIDFPQDLEKANHLLSQWRYTEDT